MNRVHTLRTIADELGRDKRTAQTWLVRAKEQHGELGEILDGTRYFNDSEREILISYASDRLVSVAQPQSSAVDVGNHNIVLSTPTLPKTYTIESLRTSDAISFDDPLALAQEFLQTADLLTQEMQRDIRQREKRLQQTITAKEQITAKTNEFKLEARLYRERAWMLDNAQTQETQNLQDSLTTLQRLGKPQDN